MRLLQLLKFFLKYFVTVIFFPVFFFIFFAVSYASTDHVLNNWASIATFLVIFISFTLFFSLVLTLFLKLVYRLKYKWISTMVFDYFLLFLIIFLFELFGAVITRHEFNDKLLFASGFFSLVGLVLAFKYFHLNISKILTFVKNIVPALSKHVLSLLLKTEKLIIKFAKLPLRKKINIIIGIFSIWLIYIALGWLNTTFQSPKVLYSYPESQAKEIPLNTNIDIKFDRKMNVGSVEKDILNAFNNMEGTFTWSESGSRIIFDPSVDLERNTNYEIKFDNTKSFVLRRYKGTSISFNTIGDPSIALHSPVGEAQSKRAPIRVVFDKPLIPLTTDDGIKSNDSPIEITPSIEGTGRWIGNSAYEFTPNDDYPLASTYTVKSIGGFKSADGGTLQPFEWSFSTATPKVITTYPDTRNMDFLPINPEFKFVLTMPVDLKSFANHASIEDGTHSISGQAFKGSLSKEEIARVRYNKLFDEDNYTVVVFKPNTRLTRGKRYLLNLKAGVIPKIGANLMTDSYNFSFSVANLPKLEYSNPKDKSTMVGSEYSERISLCFNVPMDDESLLANLSISPEPKQKVSVYSYEKCSNIYSGFDRSTHYKIHVNGEAKDINGERLNKDVDISFDTAPYPTTISIQPSQTYYGAFNAYETPRIISKVMNADEVKYNLYKLTEKQFLEISSDSYNHNTKSWQKMDFSKFENILSWSEKFSTEKNVGVMVGTKIPNKLAPGIYFIDLSLSNDAHDNMVMIVSKSNVVLKMSKLQTFAWITDYNDAKNVSGMHLKLIDKKGNVLKEGDTNNDGVWMVDNVLPTKANLSDYYIVGSSDSDYFISSTKWDDGIGTYSFDLGGHYYNDFTANEGVTGNIELDRSLYRPGQTVYYSGVIRNRDANGVLSYLKTPIDIKVKVLKRPDSVVNERELTAKDTFDGQFDLTDSIDPGWYYMKVYYNNKVVMSLDFEVEEYVRPDLSIEIAPDKSSYVNGENGTATISSSYYFGGPVKNAPVNWTLSSMDYGIKWKNDTSYSFVDNSVYSDIFYSDRSQNTINGVGMTDKNGNFVINLPTKLSDSDNSKSYVLRASVSDPKNNKSIGTSSVYIVHKGLYYVGIKPTSYSNSTNSDIKFNLVSVDTKGQEIGNIDSNVKFYRRTWNTVKEKDTETGNYYYVSKPVDTLVDTKSVSTDGNGLGKLSFNVDLGGYYIGRVESGDANGHKIISSADVWVSGKGYTSQRENNDRIQIIPDKEKYIAGETASILVDTPYTNKVPTLLTLEREKVINYKIDSIGSDNMLTSMEIPNDLIPNAFISATLMKPFVSLKDTANFKIGYSEVKIDDPTYKIVVDVKPDNESYNPNGKVLLELRTTDINGKPIKSNVTLSVIDKSVLDLSNLSASNIYDVFYPTKALDVNTSVLLTKSIDRINANTSLGSKGGSGGGGGNGQGFETYRSDFDETVFWKTNIETDENGYAKVDFNLNDSLTTYNIKATASSEQAFGEGESNFIVTKDILIRSFLPRFLSVGDVSDIGGILVNNTNKVITANISLETEGLEILKPEVKTITLKPREQYKALWSVTSHLSNNNPSEAKISIKASNGNEIYDSITKVLPLNVNYTKETTAIANSVNGSNNEVISIPDDLIDMDTSLGINLYSILGINNFNNYNYYSCGGDMSNSELASKLKILISTKMVMDDLGLATINNNSLENIDSLINKYIQTLSNLQATDGGWAWYSSGSSNTYDTNIVFDSLLLAKDNGYFVNDDVIKDAKVKTVNIISDGYDSRAYSLYNLSRTDKKDSIDGYLNDLYSKRHQLSVGAKVRLALALYNSEGKSTRAKTVYNEILGSAHLEATEVNWESTRHGGFENIDTTTGLVLQLMSTIDSNNKLIENSVRYLSRTKLERRCSWWTSSYADANVLLGISDYIVSNKVGKITKKYKVEFDSNNIAEGLFTYKEPKENETSIFDTVHINLTSNELKIGDNNLAISETGAGKLYYDARLSYYLPFKTLGSKDNGLAVVREVFDADGNIADLNNITEGKAYQVKLLIATPYSRDYVVLEDFLPAGLEALNTNLNVGIPVMNEVKKDPNFKHMYYSNVDFKDDEVVLSFNRLYPGFYEFNYNVVATTPGTYQYPGSSIYQTYTPEIFGKADNQFITVKRK